MSIRHDGELRLMDWFCGAGGSSQGAHAVPGVDVSLAANHWDRAIESHAANFPHTEHYRGDIREAPVEHWPVADLFWASPECFPAGTLILTRNGLTPVEEVVVGDKVFTHNRRWRPVTTTMHRPANTVLVKGVGLSGGIETTSEHPFYTRQRTRAWNNAERQYRYRLTGTPQWTAAKNLDRHLWATPTDFGTELPVPMMAGRGTDFDADFWWLVGRWLGDGSLRLHPKTGDGLPAQPRRTSQPSGSACIVCGAPARRHGKSTTGRVSPYCSDTCKAKNKRQDPNRGRYELTIVCGFHETDELGKRLTAVEGLRWQQRKLRTASAFTTTHRGLVEWLAKHFGQHAYGKTIPAWALTMPVAWRHALLAGYLTADGHTGATRTEATTVSKRLAIGLRMLANSVGEVANVAGPYQRHSGRTIEGRPVAERPSWSISWATGGPKHAFHAEADGYRWAPVRTVTPTGHRTEVYNISVAEDESYVADGITVHNCPQWSNARGKRRDFATSLQGDLFGDAGPSEEVERSRALMEEVPLYLRGVQERGGLVLGGVVENVTDVRAWDQFDRWRGEFHKLGYITRLVAMNSMHAQPRRTAKAPQSRNRFYMGYIHRSIGRLPDWDKWLRPPAWCPTCDRQVAAIQVWKRRGADMGSYRRQYVYRCPNTSCRNQTVEPEALPAAVAIDWSIPGQRVGDRTRPLAEKTRARIAAGLKKFARPLLVPSGGTWRNDAAPVTAPMPTRTTRENDALVVPPLLVPVEGRDGKQSTSANEPMRTQTARNETGLAWLPFIAELRGGGSNARSVSEALATVTASGNHHGLVTPQGMVEHLLVPYYGNGTARRVTDPIGALTTRDRYALVSGEVDVDDVLFRMLEPHEIGRGMAFAEDYTVLGSKREKVRQYGNAVTPNVAEVLICALVEAINGQDIERYESALPALGVAA